MRLIVTTKKYIEEDGSTRTARVCTHLPPDEEIKEVRGTLYTLLSIVSPENLDKDKAIDAFLAALERTYFTNELENIPSCLEKAVNSALFAANDIFEAYGVVNDIEFDFAAAVVKDDFLYVVKVQEPCIYLIRNNEVLDIGRSLTDVSNPVLIENGSGLVRLGDKVILANSFADSRLADWSLLSRYPEKELTRLLDANKDETGKMAFIVLEIEEEVAPRQSLPTYSFPSVPEEKTASSLTDTEALSIPGQMSLSPKSKKEKILDTGDMLVEKSMVIMKIIAKKVFTGIRYLIAKRKNLSKKMSKGGREIEGSITTDTVLHKGAVTELHSRKSNIKKNKKLTLGISIVILVLAVFAGIHIKDAIVYHQKLNTYTQLVIEAKADVDKGSLTQDASTIDNLNNKVDKIVATGRALHVPDTALLADGNQMLSLYDGAHHIIDVTSSINVLSDLSLSFPALKSDGMDLDGGNLIVTSPTTNGAIMLSASAPSSGNAISSSLISNPEGVAAISDQSAVIYDQNNGALLVDAKGNVTQIPGLTDIKNVVSIASFHGNLYFLDAADQVIYKAAAVDGGYSLASSYISDSNLADALSIAVDGNVFVASPSQGIIRYYSGAPTPFSMGGTSIMGKTPGPLTYVYDTESLSDMYVLDPQNDRVLVLAKPLTGNTYTYVKQYVYGGSKQLFNNLKAVCIDSSEKNMYLLNGSKVLHVSL